MRLRAAWAVQGPVGVGGDTEEVDASGRVFDDEQNMEPFEQHGVDASEVGRDDCFGLRANELRPCGPGPITGGVDTGGFENLPDC